MKLPIILVYVLLVVHAGLIYDPTTIINLIFDLANVFFLDIAACTKVINVWIDPSDVFISHVMLL